jgi:hypothetical protein
LYVSGLLALSVCEVTSEPCAWDATWCIIHKYTSARSAKTNLRYASKLEARVTDLEAHYDECAAVQSDLAAFKDDSDGELPPQLLGRPKCEFCCKHLPSIAFSDVLGKYHTWSLESLNVLKVGLYSPPVKILLVSRAISDS